MSSYFGDSTSEFGKWLPDLDHTITFPPMVETSLPLRRYMRDSGAPRVIFNRDGEYELTVKLVHNRKDNRYLFYVPNLYIPVSSLPVNESYIVYEPPKDSHSTHADQEYSERSTVRPFHVLNIDGVKYSTRPVKLSKFIERVTSTIGFFSQHNNLENGTRSRVEVDTDSNPIFKVMCDDIALHAYNVVNYNSMYRSIRETDYFKFHIRKLKLLVDRNNLYGKIYCNMLIHLNIFDEDDPKDSASRDISLRAVKECRKLFLDCSYTPSSTDAGVTRALVYGVLYRTIDEELIANTTKILMSVCSSIDTIDRPKSKFGWTLYFCGHSVKMPSKLVDEIVRIRASQKGPQCPSVWIYEDLKLVVLSISNGCLMRPLRLYMDPTENEKETYFDSHMIRNKRFVSSVIIDSVMSETLNHCNVMFRLIPYFEYAVSPRHNLGIGMSTQAISRPYAESFSTVRSIHTYPLIAYTPYQTMMERSRRHEDNFSFPGVSLRVCYMLRDGVLEDSVMVSSRVNDLGLFAHEGFFRHPSSKSDEMIEIGQTVTRDCDWYRLYDDGIVTSKKLGDQKGEYCTVYLRTDKLNEGDKLATFHGQKGVITIIDEDDIDVCYDPKTGLSFKPDVIMSIGSITNRGTIGQIFEGEFTVSIVGSDIENFDHKKDYGINVIDDDIKPPECICYLLDRETGLPLHELTAYSDDGVEEFSRPKPAEFHYGIVRFFHLFHLSRDKQQGSSRIPSQLQPGTGRAKSMSSKFGHMEGRALLAKGGTHCMQEIALQTSLAEVQVCPSCGFIAGMCIYTEPPDEYISVAVNYQAYVNALLTGITQIAIYKDSKTLTEFDISEAKQNSYVKYIQGKDVVYLPKFI